MNTRTLIIGGLLIAGLLWFAFSDEGQPARPDKPCPGPNCPQPNPVPRPRPKPRPRPWVPGRQAPVGAKAKVQARSNIEAEIGGRIAPDRQTQIHCDLPGDQHLKNVGGSDGAGLCVFTSVEHAARWQNVPELMGFQNWMRKRPGGGYPSKLDIMLKTYCEERGFKVPAYVQIEGRDLEVLKLACRTGRMPAVTYARSPTGRYGGGRIAHMVNLSHADDTWFAVLDNNYPGVNRYEWMTPDEFDRICNLGGSIWTVVLLGPPPPPVPSNR